MGEGEDVAAADSCAVRVIPPEEQGEGNPEDRTPWVGWTILLTILSLAALGAWRAVELLLAVV